MDGLENVHDVTLTLFTGQWADLPFEEVCRLASSWGTTDWRSPAPGDHLDADRGAAEDAAYVAGNDATTLATGTACRLLGDLERNLQRSGGLARRTRSTSGHQGILVSPWVGGVRANPEEVRRQRAGRGGEVTRPGPRPRLGVATVVGFTGSADLGRRGDVPLPRRRRRGRGGLTTSTSPSGGTRSSTSSMLLLAEPWTHVRSFLASSSSRTTAAVGMVSQVGRLRAS